MTHRKLMRYVVVCIVSLIVAVGNIVYAQIVSAAISDAADGKTTAAKVPFVEKKRENGR